MENGECPQEWLRALGGGGGEKLLGLEILHNRTGATASIMLGTKSEPAALLPPINRAMMRTRSLDTEDPAVHGGAIDAHDVDAVEQTAARRAGERGVGHKPHVGPCASNAMDQGGGAIGQTRKLVDTINEYKQNAANMQARLKNMQAMLARFALRTIKPVCIPKLARGHPQCQRAALAPEAQSRRSPRSSRPRVSAL